MLYSNVYVENIAYLLPTDVLASEAIEEKLAQTLAQLRIPRGTLEALTGIKERRVWSIDTPLAELAVQPASRLLGESGITNQTLDYLIYTGVCRQYIEPATAHLIHHALGLGEDCVCFDISDACLGFMKGLTVGANLIESGQARSILVSSAENAAPIYQATMAKLSERPSMALFKESLASLTLGSGAVACLLRHRSDAPRGHKLIGWVSKLASRYHSLCRGTGHYKEPLMVTDSLSLMREGIQLGLKTWKHFLDELGWRSESCNHIITHQVSGAHHKKFFEKLGIDHSQARSDVSWLGNTGTVAAPLSLALAKERNELGRGDKIAMLGIGSGINSLIMGLEW